MLAVPAQPPIPRHALLLLYRVVRYLFSNQTDLRRCCVLMSMMVVLCVDVRRTAVLRSLSLRLRGGADGLSATTCTSSRG